MEHRLGLLLCADGKFWLAIWSFQAQIFKTTIQKPFLTVPDSTWDFRIWDIPNSRKIVPNSTYMQRTVGGRATGGSHDQARAIGNPRGSRYYQEKSFAENY